MDGWQFIIRTWTNRKSKGNIVYLPWIDDMFEVIKAADVVVARAGYSTVCDLMCFGKKSILIPQPSQLEQEALAEHLQKEGAAYRLLQRETAQTPGLLEKIYCDKKIEDALEKYSSLFLKNNMRDVAGMIVFSDSLRQTIK